MALTVQDVHTYKVVFAESCRERVLFISDFGMTLNYMLKTATLIVTAVIKSDLTTPL
jgi:hypothetical protein